MLSKTVAHALWAHLSEASHAPDSRYRRLPEDDRRPSARHLPGRRDRAHRRLDDRTVADPEGGRGSKSSRSASRSPRWRSPAPCSANSPCCWIRRTPRTWVPWRRHGYTSPTRPLCSRETRSRCFALRRSGTASRRRQPCHIEMKQQLQAGEPHSVIGETVEKIEGLPGAGGASLVYAGHPYDRSRPTQRRAFEGRARAEHLLQVIFAGLAVGDHRRPDVLERRLLMPRRADAMARRRNSRRWCRTSAPPASALGRRTSSITWSGKTLRSARGSMSRRALRLQRNPSQ